MAKKPENATILLRWSSHVRASDVQDPLGLGLRGSARLASLLLYCITSITPRARYFSFIPWCIFDYQQREKDKPHALGLDEAIVLRERAFALACVAYHEGEACDGGALVGSEKAQKLFANGTKEVDLKSAEVRFTKDPARKIYFNSLVNLGVFLTDEEMSDLEEEIEKSQRTFDDIELSQIGKDLARSFDSISSSQNAVRQLAAVSRKCSVRHLADWGAQGGLCELSGDGAPDRQLLRDIFFALTGRTDKSHAVRRQSLLLILELCRQFSADDWLLNEPDFAGAVYYGELVTEDGRLEIALPPYLIDIAQRWRMFYFHHYMGVALEGLFAWLVSQVASCGLGGTTIESLVARLREQAVRKGLSELLQIELAKPFGDLTPCDLFGHFNVPHRELDAELSTLLDHSIRSAGPVSEDTLESLIRGGKHLHSSTGLALPMILLALTLARYVQWETTKYGHWLAKVAEPNPYLDLVPPVLTGELSRRNWWKCTWNDLSSFFLSRYVVRQHLSMSFEKNWIGDRCLLQEEWPKLFASGVYEKIGMGNPRLRSALRILKDLGLMEDAEDGATHLTKDGKLLLQRETAKEVSDEVP
jgi:hypothetical protein